MSKLISVGEISNYKKGYAFKSKDYASEGVPIVKVSDFGDHTVSKSSTNLNYEVSEGFEDWKLKKNDILIATVGSWATNPNSVVGKVVYVEDGLNNALLNQNCVRLRTIEGYDQKFLFYSLKTSNFSNHCVSSAQGSANQASITLDDINLFKIPNYSLMKQKRISNFLSDIDNKIILNQQMNETLEEIAKTLFKSWFIDFDPVIANSEGSSTGLSKDISDLFPDTFESSEIGEIPKGWKLLTFGDFVKPTRGKVITKKKTDPGSVPVVAGGLEPAYFHSTANVQGPVVTISASGANAGYVNLYHQDIWASDCSYISNNQTSNVFTSYIFLKINQRRIFESQHGAAQPHVYPDDLKRLHMVSPDKDLFSIYENLVTPFFNKIKLNKDQSDKLISLRDILLPKLISGELMVSEIESLTEEASV